jgi:hypothetical protein
MHSRKFILTAMFFFSAFHFANTFAHTKTQVKSITIDRMQCYGACPVYRLTINNTGVVNFKGIKYFEDRGAPVHSVPAATFDKLVALTDQVKFFELNKEYGFLQSGCKGWATDQPSMKITVRTSKKSKSVSFYYGCHDHTTGEVLAKIARSADQAAGLKPFR